MWNDSNCFDEYVQNLLNLTLHCFEVWTYSMFLHLWHFLCVEVQHFASSFRVHRLKFVSEFTTKPTSTLFHCLADDAPLLQTSQLWSAWCCRLSWRGAPSFDEAVEANYRQNFIPSHCCFVVNLLHGSIASSTVFLTSGAIGSRNVRFKWASARMCTWITSADSELIFERQSE